MQILHRICFICFSGCRYRYILFINQNFWYFPNIFLYFFAYSALSLDFIPCYNTYTSRRLSRIFWFIGEASANGSSGQPAHHSNPEAFGSPCPPGKLLRSAGCIFGRAAPTRRRIWTSSTISAQCCVNNKKATHVCGSLLFYWQKSMAVRA